MKTSHFLLLIVLAIGLGFFIGIYNRPDCPPTNFRLVPQARWDSLIALANRPPDTVKWTDTIRPPADTVWRERKPIPIPEPHGEINYYADTFRDSNVLILIQDSIKGILKDRKIGYELFVPKQVNHYIEVTKNVPFPFEVPVEVRIGYKYYALIGYGPGAYSAEGGLLYKKIWMVGIQGLKAKENYVCIKAGILF